ncbi:MAG: tRNA (adenosine(37)-N6)-dimethylallyltransferase MiaA, partial [Alphaproteobacteria bacterium]|nr:tRNA (adenosine(37)-N6)-dimethylallyltransferase MiaA [Alphaproteobacteria bacterium]
MRQSVSFTAMSGNHQNVAAVNVVIVAGPTCSGKSALALDLAEHFAGAVINADSMQVYRELRILTARPTLADEARVPHRLYGVLSVAEECSAARWREMAVTAIDETHRAGRLPILCGGTGLYLKALTEGLSPMPDIPAAVRQSVRARFEGADAPAIHAALQAVDPAMAARLTPTDRQRLLRALEVYEATGQSLAEWQAAPAEGPPAGYVFHTILVTPPRAELYADCDARFQAMLDAGALDEARRLR